MTNKVIADTLNEIADAIESGNFGKKIKIGLTTLGSEHGSENLIKGAQLAKNDNFEIVLIGKKAEGFESYETSNEEEMYDKMEELLDSKYIDACVTMHYNFPIGVSTVGKVITPALGKEMFIANTTGTSATNRVEAMVRNAISGISCAKASGIEKPKVGILNVDGARQAEKILNTLKENGYEMEFATSQRKDGGAVMRGNDLLLGSCDVMVCDSLTGNILMKVLSSFNSGGSYETLGYGYGPGIGENYDRKVLIISRASGSPVVANALRYAYEISKGNISEVSKEEYKKANKFGLNDEIANLSKKTEIINNENITIPDKEIVTASIGGIEILDLEDAVQLLWKENIYAESGMGCTGPVVLVSEKNKDNAINILKNNDFIA